MSAKMKVMSALAVVLITACIVQGKKEQVVDPDFDEFEFDFDFNEDEDEPLEGKVLMKLMFL